MPSRKCDNCGHNAPTDEQMYTLRLQMFARVAPLIFTAKDLEQDHVLKLEELVKQMESADPEEAEAQVFETYNFDLCSRCRRKMHRQLKAKTKSGKKQKQ